jgi:hypothetical protein
VKHIAVRRSDDRFAMVAVPKAANLALVKTYLERQKALALAREAATGSGPDAVAASAKVLRLAGEIARQERSFTRSETALIADILLAEYAAPEAPAEPEPTSREMGA